jgi:hypothetical protein
VVGTVEGELRLDVEQLRHEGLGDRTVADLNVKFRAFICVRLSWQ